MDCYCFPFGLTWQVRLFLGTAGRVEKSALLGPLRLMVILASELLGCRHFLRSLIKPTFSCSESLELLSLGYLLVLFEI